MFLITIAQLVVRQEIVYVHAIIVFSDGSGSEELFSEADAFAYILKVVQEKKLHPVEAEYLREEVRRSPLPRETPENARSVFAQWKRETDGTGNDARKRLH